MKSIFYALLLLFSATANISCSKDKIDEDLMRGTWVNQNNPGDTLIFFRKNGNYTLKLNYSFNPTLPQYTEVGYKFQNDSLRIILPPFSSAPHRNIQSFQWVKRGKEFTVKGHEIYMFMSSTIAEHRYQKVK